MSCWCLLLFALLQVPIDQSNDPGPARDEVLPGVLVEQIPLSELRQRIANGDYVPVPRSQLRDLFQNAHNRIPGPKVRPPIREARYMASLDGTRLEDGRLEFDFYPASGTKGSYPLLIGQTSLQQLRVSDQQGSIELGSDSARRLFLLQRDLPGKLTGTWMSDGLVTGELVTFRLELPPATTTQFELLTKPETLVTSAGSLILGPEPLPMSPDASSADVGQQLKWTILPGDASHLTFSCHEQRLLQPLNPMPLAAFHASHVLDPLSEDILNSRWSVGLPADLNGRVRLTARISSGARVSAVLLEDKRQVDWHVKEENGQQVLNVILPAASESATFTVFAASVLPLSESWDLPMLSFDQWFGLNDEQHGPVVVPIGQISVLLPPAVHLDEWTLVGIQERDIVTGPNQNREYKLVQFLPQASAIARTSTSEPQLEDSVVTIVEPAGRLATVQCLVNVACQGASVVELQWPVSQGWQVIGARYASNARSLFFEFPKADPEAATSTLTLHLPESLEPGTSRMVEIQFRQLDESDGSNIKLPLAENLQIQRIGSIVVFPPALTLSTELQRRWSASRQLLSPADVRSLMQWLPESKLPAGGQVFAVGNTESARPGATMVSGISKSSTVELEHAVRIVEGQIVETSRIVLPTDQQFGDNLTLLIPTQSAKDSRWSMNGRPIPAKLDDTEGELPDWRRWTVNLAGRRSEDETVIRCESRQSADHEIIATIPVPVTSLPVHGILQLFSSDEGQLVVKGLTPAVPENSVESLTDDPVGTWELPAAASIVSVEIGQNSGIRSGQTIDIQMLRMMDEQSGPLHSSVMVVANVSRRAGQNSLQLELPAGVHPLVLVNGYRVQLQETTDGFTIPLPVSPVECQVVMTWTEPAESPDKVTGIHELPRLFTRELAAPQCTHHLLVSPELEVSATETEFAAAGSTNVMHLLDRLIQTSPLPSGSSEPITAKNVPSEIRSFVSRWQLATLSGWQKRTLIDTVKTEAPIVVRVTKLRRRVAIAIGTALLVVALCVVLRKTILAYRLSVALVAVSLMGINFLLTVSITEAILTGMFWGLLVGLTAISLMQWRWIQAIGRKSSVRTVAAGLLMTVSLTCSGQQTVTGKPGNDFQASTATERQSSNRLPDILLPEGQLFDKSVAYVRKTMLEKWQKRFIDEQSAVPTAVVTSLHAEVIADSVDSIELLLTLEVATLSGGDVCFLTIPLQGSRLVYCAISGEPVLPEPDGPNAVRIPIPGSMLLPMRSLTDSADKSADWTAHQKINEGVADGTAVDAGPRAAFTFHQIECRLRPVTTSQTSGLQFRLPALPCPVAAVKVSAPEGLFSRVRAQSAVGVAEWKPADNAVPFNGLAMSEGIDIRLFLSGVEKGSPKLANVDILTVAEAVAEQPVLSCFCRFSGWNPLTPEVRYIVPQGYLLDSVGNVDGGELLWSTKERTATILLPNSIGRNFVLLLRLKAIASSPLLQRRIPIAELIQFSESECVVSKNLHLAVRANPAFSVLPIEGPEVTTRAFNDVQSAWGQWLRRSDSIFVVPTGLAECIVRLTARRSLNEVRIDQTVKLRNKHFDWDCRIDIDTSVLPVFRHHITISPEIEITNVQANVGEANRLASWHRRGDRLFVQLKEGTTGQHILRILGRQILRPDDMQISIRSPHVQDAQILESVLELTDQEGLGMAIAKLGSAVPNDRIQNNDPLQPDVPIRLQILEESDPIVLQRLQPVKPIGAVAVLRSTDQAAFVVHLSQWSASLGPLEMRFAEDTEFLMEPSVFVDDRLFALLREGNKYVAGLVDIRELFDQPDFSIIWSMPIPESQRGEESMNFAWPEISDRIQWNERLLIPLDAATGAATKSLTSRPVPAWLKDSSARGFGTDLSTLKADFIDNAVAMSASGQQLIVPLNHRAEVSDTDVVRTLSAVSDSFVWADPGQSAVGQTAIMVFTPLPPARCDLIIPQGTVVTELETSEAIRWDGTDRKRVTLKLTKPVTMVQIRWMSEQARSGFVLSSLEFSAPFPADCATHRTVTVASSKSERPQFSSEIQTVPSADLYGILRAEIAAGLMRCQKEVAAVAASGETLPSSDELAARLASLRTTFGEGFLDESQPKVIMASCRPEDNGRVKVFSRKRLQWPAVLSIAAGFLAVAGAAFGQTLRSEVSESVTRIAAKSSDFGQSVARESQTNADGQTPTGGSASGGTTRQPQS